MSTFYIVPAVTDLAGQCRIVRHDRRIDNPSRHYNEHPEEWCEAGIMNSRGKLICLTASAETVQIFRECEPLMAGLAVHEDCQ
mgnify:CR=1 FL=1